MYAKPHQNYSQPRSNWRQTLHQGRHITVGTIVGLMASGHTKSDIKAAYSYLEIVDIYEALAYAAWRAEEIEVPLLTA